MKNALITALLLLVAIGAGAQNPDSLKQPKIRYSAGFFTARYEIGDKDATQEAILLHMEKTSAEGYFHLKRATQMQTNALAWSIVGLSGALVGLLAKKPEAKALGWGAAAIGLGVSFSIDIGAQSKIERGINSYNKQYGYGI